MKPNLPIGRPSVNLPWLRPPQGDLGKILLVYPITGMDVFGINVGLPLSPYLGRSSPGPDTVSRSWTRGSPNHSRPKSQPPFPRKSPCLWAFPA
jgi:hypothetical protein